MRSDVAISAAHLSKRYLIGGSAYAHTTFRDHVAHAARRVLRGRLPEERPAEFWALQDVSLDIKQGEILGIIGRNGAGKSTLLKILARITEPTAGEAVIRGRLGSLLEVGTGFHPELSGRENVFLSGAILGMKRREIQRRFDEIVAFAEIERFIDTPVKRYSSGMYVRLAFAVAAHLEPDILLVDEVLAVGDFAFQRKCLGKLESEVGSGRTVVFISHSLGAVRSICDRCIMLDGGRIIADGPSAEVVEAYVTRFVAPPSMLSGDVRDDWAGGYRLCAADGVREFTRMCGAALAFEFDIEAPNVVSSEWAGVGLTFYTRDGNPLVSMSSNVQSLRSATGSSRVWRVRCELGRLPLNAGTYTVRVYLGSNDRTIAQFSNAFSVRMLENDVYGWGNNLPSPMYWGPVYWAPEWEIQPVDVKELAAS